MSGDGMVKAAEFVTLFEKCCKVSFICKVQACKTWNTLHFALFTLQTNFSAKWKVQTMETWNWPIGLSAESNNK